MKKNIYLLFLIVCCTLNLFSQVYVVQDVYIASGTEVYVKDTIILDNDNIKIEGTLASSIIHSNSKLEKVSPCLVLENPNDIYYTEVPKEEIESTKYLESPLEKNDSKLTQRLIDDSSVLTEANPTLSIPFPIGGGGEKLFSEREGLYIEHKKWVKHYDLAPLKVNFVCYFSELSLETYIGYIINVDSYKIVTEESKRGPPLFVKNSMS